MLCDTSFLFPTLFSGKARAALMTTAAFLVGGLAAQAQPIPGPVPAASKSSTLAMYQNDKRLIAVNRDSDSVTVFKIAKQSGDLKKQVEIPVGGEPRFVAIGGGGLYAYVSNAKDGTVSVIKLKGTGKNSVIKTIDVGTEPRGIAATPSGATVYVANFTAGTVSVIDTKKNKLVDTIDVGGNPYAVSVTNDGDSDDDDEKVFVTRFHAEADPDGSGEGFDDGRRGVVMVFPVAFPQFLVEAYLSPQASGFTADRAPFCTKFNALAHSDVFCPDPDAAAATDAVIAQDPQGVFPNQLADIDFANGSAYVLALGAAPEPPVKFNVNVQALVSAIDCDSLLERQDLFTNLNNQIKAEAQPAEPIGSLARLFGNDVVAMAVGPLGDEMLIVSRGGNYVFRAAIGADGTVSLNAPDVVRIQTGNLPSGVVYIRSGLRAYVNNELDRTVSKIDLEQNAAVAAVESSAVPAPGSEEHRIALGKLVFFTALGVPDNGGFDIPLREIDPLQHRNKASDNGWSSCASCHPDGLADSVTWYFATGPRQTLPLDSFFAKDDPTNQRIANWSAVQGSVTDFNNNARGVQGGEGFAGNPPPTTIFNHGIRTGASDSLDAMTDWVKTVRTLNVPQSTDAVAIAAARTLFSNNCASCHGGSKWTKSTVVYQDNPAFNSDPLQGGTPVDPGVVNAGPQVVSFTAGGTLKFLDDIGTFSAANPLELRGNGQAGQTALGALGFNAPSLLGVGTSAPYFHDGSASTFDAVFARHALGATTIAQSFNPQDLANLKVFLASIDGNTETFASAADPFLP